MINVCSGRLDSLYYAAKLHIFQQTAKKKQKKPSLTNGIALAGPCELIARESGDPLLRGFLPQPYHIRGLHIHFFHLYFVISVFILIFAAELRF